MLAWLAWPGRVRDSQNPAAALMVPLTERDILPRVDNYRLLK